MLIVCANSFSFILQNYSDQNFPSAIKSPDKSCYTVPEIGPDEQLNVDTKSSDRISAGARVMALWKDNYYAAIICE